MRGGTTRRYLLGADRRRSPRRRDLGRSLPFPYPRYGRQTRRLSLGLRWGNGGTGDVAAQVLQLLAQIGGAAYLGVQAKALRVDAALLSGWRRLARICIPFVSIGPSPPSASSSLAISINSDKRECHTNWMLKFRFSTRWSKYKQRRRYLATRQFVSWAQVPMIQFQNHVP
jgi:hypothetical protein